MASHRGYFVRWSDIAAAEIGALALTRPGGRRNPCRLPTALEFHQFSVKQTQDVLL